MDDTLKTLVYSVIGVIVGVCIISAGWLIRENRKMYARYLQEKYLWYEKNRDLEFKLDQMQASLEEFKRKFHKTQSYITMLEEEKKAAEEKLQELADENEKLREKVTRLVKDNQNFEHKLQQYKQSPQPLGQDEFWSNVLRDKANLELRLNSLERLLHKKDEQIQNVDQERQKLEMRVENLSRDKKQLEAKIEEIKKVVSDLSASLEQVKKEKLHYIEELHKLEAQKQDFANRLQKMKEEKDLLEQRISQLEAQLESARKQRENYARRLSGINRILEDKMLEVTKLKQDLEIALENVKKLSYGLSSPSAVELPKIEVNTTQLQGKVLKADLDNGFAIIDLGKRDGIKEGMKCNVYKQGNLIGKLEVIKTEEVTSAAKIITNLPQEPIAKDDLVTVSK